MIGFEKIEKRLQIFHETDSMCRQDLVLQDAIRQSVQDQKIYWEKDPVRVQPPRFSNPAELQLRSAFTLEAAQPFAKAGKKVAVLNFAASVVPGGGVVKGSNAQEETLCRISTLYPAISHLSVSEFYERHRALIAEKKFNGKNSDDCIYTPGVVVIREDGREEHVLSAEDRYSVDVITCAAPDQRHHEGVTDYRPDLDALYQCFLQRIRRILQIAAANAADVLILGAFGCGAFRNNPWVVKDAFYAAFQCDENRRQFETVQFAIPYNAANPNNYEAFSEIPGIERKGESGLDAILGK